MELPDAYSKLLLTPRRHAWRWGLPVILVLLFLAILTALPYQAQRMEANERQQQLIADTLWVEQTVRFQLTRNEESLKLIATEIQSGRLEPKKFMQRVAPLLTNAREIRRVAWFDTSGRVLAASDLSTTPLQQLPAASQEAATGNQARYALPESTTNTASTSATIDYFVPLTSDFGSSGTLMMSYSPTALLDEMVPWWFAQDNQIDLLDGDDQLLAQRTAGGAGHGVYTHQRTLDLEGATLTLRTNSVKSAPSLMPNLLVGSVVALSLGLAWSLWALWRDINRRLATEGALREQVQFRTAMENSLVTGMRARDLEGRLTYVNPAFCAMVGMTADSLLGKLPPMPYWAPEAMADYQKRFAQVLAGTVTPQGFETFFQRADGSRFPVLIFESALLDAAGRQTGWMGSILDISERRMVEDLNRRQQEKLQSSARLASMGEIASTLAHELNQPLAAISSYVTGALNLLANDRGAGSQRDALLQPALEKTVAQAQRAGQIIRSVHAFVKQRETSRDLVHLADVFESVEPLIQLQAQPSFVKIEIELAPNLPAVLANPTLLEQVILNLTRNAIESMQQNATTSRLLRIIAVQTVSSTGHAVLLTSVIDTGHGIAPEVDDRLYSPFFSTKAEGMGMGLNICRSAVEFHGGTLTHAANPGGGTIFCFTLPVADARHPAFAASAKAPAAEGGTHAAYR